MTEIILKAELRSKIKGGNPKRMLKEDVLPGVVYGPGVENINLKLNYQDFLKVFKQAGESKVVNLTVGDKTEKVFIHKIQKNPVTDKITHVDFYQFDKDKKFSVDVPINFIGESKAVKEDGVLVTNINSILVECLYIDLISEIEVDLSVLENLNDSIYVSDLKIDEKVNVLTSPERVIVAVKPMRTEEEEAEAEAEAEEEEAEAEKAEGEEEAEEGEGETDGEDAPKDSEKKGEEEKKE